VEKYLAVFRRIFDETGHGGHYRMMLGPDAVIDDEIPAETVAIATEMLEASGVLPHALEGSP
jgi:hypothetical protein